MKTIKQYKKEIAILKRKIKSLDKDLLLRAFVPDYSIHTSKNASYEVTFKNETFNNVYFEVRRAK